MISEYNIVRLCILLMGSQGGKQQTDDGGKHISDAEGKNLPENHEHLRECDSFDLALFKKGKGLMRILYCL